jgi:hypothetical protein
MLIINTKDLAKYQVQRIRDRYHSALWYAYGYKDAKKLTIDANEFAKSEAQLAEAHERRGGHLRSIQDSFQLWLAG